MRRSVNARVLLVLLGTALVLGTCVHLLHIYQMQENASALARHAQRALAQGELDKAATYFDRYLAFMPGDTDALAQLGQVFDLMASGPDGRRQALERLEQVLRRDPSRRDLRRRVVSLAIDQRQFQNALDHLKRLLPGASPSEQGELEHLVGWCQDALGHPSEAVEAFREAVQHAPRRVASYVLLAEVFAERLGQSEEATKVMDSLVTANPGSLEAWLTRARFREAHEDREGAARDLGRARALEPARTDLALEAADLARRRGKPDEARALLQESLKAQPQATSLYSAIADLEVREGRPAYAVTCLRQGIKENPEAKDLILLLADLLLDDRNVPEAEALLARLRRLNAQPARTDYLEARVHMEHGQWAEARTMLERIRPELSAMPAWACQVEICLGQCHEKLGAAERQLACYRRAVALNPSAAVAHYHLGLALLAAGNLDEAFAELRKISVPAGAPRETRRLLYTRMTLLMVERRRFTEADQVVRQAALEGLLDRELARHGAQAALGVGDGARALLLARQAVPESARDYRDLLWLAHVLEAAGEPYQAAQVLRTAAVRNPGLPEVWAALVGVLTRSGRPEEAQPTAEEAERKLPPERLALGLARCAEALGNLDQAEEHYQNSLEKDPGDGVLLRAAIEFFRRTDQPRKAEVLLRRLLDPRTQAPPDYAARARRQLAMVLASSGKDPDYREALALLGGRGATGENERARAMVLASRPQQRPLALRLFEESLKGQPISEDDQFLRAQLCEAAGAHQQARLLLLDLLATNPENPQYLAFHIRGLVRQGDLTAVRFFLDKLERIEPRSARMSELRTLIAYREQDGLRK